MLPDLDTHAAALKLERDLVLTRAERRALRSFFVAEVDRDKLVVAGHG